MYKVNRYTPLRYPGGKARFAPFVKKVYDKFELKGGKYAEVYAGGAGVAIDLLLTGFCEDIYINDIDPAIYSFWKSVSDYSTELIDMIDSVEISMDEWYKQKEILNNTGRHTILDVGFATFFLNRTNRSGILKAGVIGGKNQEGNYKLDSRFNKKNLIGRLKAIAKKSEYIHVYNMDAIDFLQEMNRVLSRDDFIYLDPPYYVKGQGLYRNFYHHSDHELVRDELMRMKCNWLVSYDNCDQIKEIYDGCVAKEYSLGYSANVVKDGKEIVFFSDRLQNGKNILIN